ncbi:MAG TPA: PIG-L family deacetylase, partial [Candidatus Saccharimonadales bacterium]
YAFFNKRITDNLIARWLVATVAAGAGSLVLVWIITINKITSFTSSGSLSPYGVVTNVHNVILGIFYAVSSVFTNLGANPAANTTIIRSIPHALVNNFLSLSSLGFITNLIILIFGLFLAYKLIKDSFIKKNKKQNVSDEVGSKLAILLIWTSVSAFVVFIVSNHDYSVDSRYLGIVLFTIFVAIAVYSSRQKIQPEILALIGLVIGFAALSGTYFAWHSYQADMAAMNDQNNRNQIISEVLKVHPVNTLVGDYWRVVPIKLNTGNKQNIIPLGDCTTPRQSLSSSVWNADLGKNSFAYLLSLSGGNLTNYPNCTINQVTNYYGKPNSSQVVEGSLSSPSEVLLYYENGVTKKSAITTTPTSSLSTILPVDISSLPAIDCDSPTAVNIVAHEDDDLLFMNPDILNEIKDGYCERTIYVTSGDAGNGPFYYLSRQRGSEAAYAEMTGSKDIWTQKTIKIAADEYVTLASLSGDSKISLVFMHLPDGGLQGQGYRVHNFQSIDKLYAGAISNITTVDGQSNYTIGSLGTALTNLINLFKPAEIRTQSTYSGGNGPIKDHPDHNIVGRLVTKATANYNQNQFSNLTAIPIKYYEGYPLRDSPVNLSGSELTEKENAFLAYSVYDGSTCANLSMCQEIPTYWGYLQRQYALPY